MLNDWKTDGAAVKDALPAWSACTVQVPTANRLIIEPFVPDEPQIVGVVTVNVTARPDDAVALAVAGPLPSSLLAIGANVIV